MKSTKLLITLSCATVAGCSQQQRTPDGGNASFVATNSQVTEAAVPMSSDERADAKAGYDIGLKCVAAYALARAANPSGKDLDENYHASIDTMNEEAEKLKIPDDRKESDFKAAMDNLQKDISGKSERIVESMLSETFKYCRLANHKEMPIKK